MQGLAWNFVETHKSINEHFKWADKAMPFQIAPIEDLVVNQGVVYFYKRDKGHRPVCVIMVERLLSSKVPLIQCLLIHIA